jgi:hypothetical protein
MGQIRHISNPGIRLEYNVMFDYTELKKVTRLKKISVIYTY